MLRVMTFNANGIRSALRKGFWTWFETQKVDILCVQELKAQIQDIPQECQKFDDYAAWFHCAQKAGYSGCGLWSRKRPNDVQIGFGEKEFDAEGRYVRVDFDKLSVVSAYFPSGTSGEVRQEAKYRFLEQFFLHMEKLRNSGREVIICGDFNIAHQKIDLANWRGNLRHSGFLPEERAWLSKCFDGDCWVDVFRRLDPRPDQYTWWSQRGRAREKNVGWRIDYEVATPGIAQMASLANIYQTEKFSDHAPLTIEYEGDWI